MSPGRLVFVIEGHRAFLRENWGIDLKKPSRSLEFKASEFGIVVGVPLDRSNNIFVVTSSGNSGWIYASDVEVIS